MAELLTPDSIPSSPCVLSTLDDQLNKENWVGTEGCGAADVLRARAVNWAGVVATTTAAAVAATMVAATEAIAIRKRIQGNWHATCL